MQSVPIMCLYLARDTVNDLNWFRNRESAYVCWRHVPDKINQCGVCVP